MKKILITGGAGFIGSSIIAEYQKFNHEIFVIDNLSFGNREFIDIPDNCFFNINIRDREKVNSVVSSVKPHYILHLAAIHFIPYCNQHPFESSDINITGTVNIIEAAKNVKELERLMFASTAAVYPICDVAVNENVTPSPMDIYGVSKFAGEYICREFHLSTGIPVVVARFFNAFGPNETNPHLIPEIQKQVNEGNRKIKLGNLTPKRDFIHTSDMATALRMLIDKSESGFDIFNLGRGEEYSVTEIVEAFERQLGEKIEIEVEETRVRKVERMHLLADIKKIKEFTGWNPLVSIDEGIRTLLNNR
jgi:UDP-glucose 4-epimerase